MYARGATAAPRGYWQIQIERMFFRNMVSGVWGVWSVGLSVRGLSLCFWVVGSVLWAVCCWLWVVVTVCQDGFMNLTESDQNSYKIDPTSMNFWSRGVLVVPNTVQGRVGTASQYNLVASGATKALEMFFFLQKS